MKRTVPPSYSKMDGLVPYIKAFEYLGPIVKSDGRLNTEITN